MTEIVYLNGQFKPAKEATLSIYDRSVLFGEGVYEVVPIYNGKPLALDLHYQRLVISLKTIFIQPVFDLKTWHELILQLLQHNDYQHKNCLLYTQITRGSTFSRSHKIPHDLQPTVILFIQPFVPPDPLQNVICFKVVTLADKRWQRCFIKATSLLGNILSIEEAKAQQADDAILIRNGLVTESNISNIFIVKNNIISTPIANELILNGIARQLTIALAHQQQITCHERDIKENELYEADEIWLTSSSKEIAPAIELNNQPVGTGRPGPLWCKFIKLFEVYKNQLLAKSYAN